MARFEFVGPKHDISGSVQDADGNWYVSLPKPKMKLKIKRCNRMYDWGEKAFPVLAQGILDAPKLIDHQIIMVIIGWERPILCPNS